MLALAREAGELPDQDLLEGRGGLRGFVQHLAELGPVGDAPAFSLVNVFPSNDVAVALGVIAQRAKLSSDGEIDVLSLAGDSGVEGRRDQVIDLGHGRLLHSFLFASE